ncbi:hypothetical protein NA57DRAFT_75122 [Rhizodiscina lignyota]|uniref:Uncharacterized protein n=1 Tax=Rhizodiscina lignyota TaxID=1504668 RepID=A0A9P4ID24_9PEZI|nr:hypothetical protein NA57DRAFT_75122 [Rhizodiscina lignyota]
MSASTYKHLRPPPAKVPPPLNQASRIEKPVTSFQSFIKKAAPKPSASPAAKELPLTPTAPTDPKSPLSQLEAEPLSRIRAQLRASSIYSRSTTGTWEPPDWWRFGEDDSNEQDVDFILPPTVYHEEAQRRLESKSPLPFEEPVTPRTYSPLIPEPSPSPEPSSEPSTAPSLGRPEAQSLESHTSSRLSIPEDYEREWAPLPPTPPSPPAFTYPIQTPPRDNAEVLCSLDPDPNFGPPPSTPPLLSPSALSPSPPPESLASPTTFNFTPDDQGLEAYQTFNESKWPLRSPQPPEPGPRGRTVERKLPPDLHDRNYVRTSGEQAHDGELGHRLEPISEDLTPAVEESPTILRRKQDSPDAHELLEQRRAKTLSEAYHMLLIEQYQDLAAEGRAWEALSEHTASVLTDDEDGREIKMVPQPLFFRHASVRHQQHDDGGYHRFEDLRPEDKGKGKGLLSPSAFKKMLPLLPSKLSRRHDSATSGEIPISPPFEEDEGMDMNSRGRPRNGSLHKHGKKSWSKQSPPQAQHIPPLPLQLPQSVSPRPSLEQRSKRGTHSTESSVASGSRRASPHGHVRQNTEESYRHVSPSSQSRTNTGEPYPRPMHRAPHMENPQAAPQRELPPLPAHKSHISFSQPQPQPQTPKLRHSKSYKRFDDEVSVGSKDTSWSFLQRSASQRSGGEKDRHGASALFTKAWESRSGKAKQRAHEKKKDNLKKSIHLVGQVDPRYVETVDDTTRRLAYRTRKDTFGQGWT